MHIEIHPRVEGLAAERLFQFAAALAAPENGAANHVLSLVEQEAAWARRTPHLNGQTKAYEACLRLLADLRSLKWQVRADTFGIELVSPRRSRPLKGAADFAAADKARLREELRPALAAQFADPRVLAFLHDCENPPPGKKRHSILRLVADGAELAARLETAAASPGTDPLSAASVEEIIVHIREGRPGNYIAEGKPLSNIAYGMVKKHAPGLTRTARPTAAADDIRHILKNHARELSAEDWASVLAGPQRGDVIRRSQTDGGNAAIEVWTPRGDRWLQKVYRVERNALAIHTMKRRKEK